MVCHHRRGWQSIARLAASMRWHSPSTSRKTFRLGIISSSRCLMMRICRVRRAEQKGQWSHPEQAPGHGVGTQYLVLTAPPHMREESVEIARLERCREHLLVVGLMAKPARLVCERLAPQSLTLDGELHNKEHK